MHLLFAAPGAPGHVNPTLPLIRELSARGHEITYATDPAARAEVEAAGAHFAALPPLVVPPPEPGAGPDAVMGAMMQALVGYQAGLLRDGVVAGLLERTGAGAVCYDGMLAPPVRAVTDPVGVPAVALHPTYAPPPTTPDAAPPPGLAAMYDALAGSGRDVAAAQGVPGLDPFGGPPAALNIVFVPREFQPGGEGYDPSFHFVGPDLSARAADDGWEPPAGRPAVLVSLGTSPFNADAAFLRAAIEAFADGAWQVLMAVGDRIDPAELGGPAPHVRIERYVPQLVALRHVDVFVSHTGMNSTLEALLAQVPVVAVPQQPEQEANAAQVERLGAGLRLAAGERTPAAIRAAVERVHADPAVRTALAGTAAALRRAGGAVAAADAIEKHLAGRF